MSVYRNGELTPDCTVIEEMIPDYAFGLTTPEETRLVEANLARCPSAAARLAEFERLQDEMRENVPQIAPPAALGDRLLIAAGAASPPSKPRRHLPSWGWIAAAAALLIITNAYWLLRTNEMRREYDELAALVAGTGHEGTAFVLTSTEALRWRRLAPPEDSDRSAFLMWNAESQTGLLYARGFPEAAAGQGYQLWLGREGQRVSGGVFQVDENGDGALLFRLPEPIDLFTRAGITVEPAAGSPAPTGSVMVNGDL
jgi:anti-sigma-K factor RskA